MSGASWSRLEATFHDSPKVKRLARRLGIPPVLARGHLATLWSWACTHAPDGDLRQYDAQDIEDAAEWAGPPGELFAALCEPSGGFGPWIDALEADTEGPARLALHGYWERAEAHKRAAEMRRRRAAEHRRTTSRPPSETLGPEPVETPVGNALLTRDARVTTRGEEKRRDPPPPYPPPPTALPVPLPAQEEEEEEDKGRETGPDRAAKGSRIDDRPSAKGSGRSASSTRPRPSQDWRPSEPEGGVPEELVREVLAAWNAHATLPRGAGFPPGRREALAAAIAEDPARREAGWWRDYIARIAASSWCRGEGERSKGWRADLDWALGPDNIARVLEGRYDDLRRRVVPRPSGRLRLNDLGREEAPRDALP